MAALKPEQATENKSESKTNTDPNDSEDLIIVIVSDTHGHHAKIDIPSCADILIHCGDFTNFSNVKHLVSFNEWLGTLPMAHKIVVTGNHDVKANFELKSGGKINLKAIFTNATLLHNEMLDVCGLNIFGHGWKGNIGHMNWNSIPLEADIVITHNPPKGILDGGQGCEVLRKRVETVKPLIHCYGHIHMDYGIYVDKKQQIHYVNAASVDHMRKPVHDAILLKIVKQKDKNHFVQILNQNPQTLVRSEPNKKNKMQNQQRFAN